MRAVSRSTGFDFQRIESVRDALAGIEKVFLLSPPLPDAEIRFVDEAVRAGVRHVVKISVWKAPAEEYSYAKTHRRIERAIESTGIAWTFLRPNSFMQNFLGRSEIRAPRAAVSHVDAEDVAAVAAEVLAGRGHEGKAYDLSGPAALSFERVAHLLSLPYFEMPAADDLDRYNQAGRAAEVTPWVEKILGRPATPFEKFAARVRKE